MIQVLEKEIHGEKLIFTNLRAIYWEKEQTLIFSDLHVGKSAHFRKNGIAIPGGILEKDLKNLEKLIAHFDVQHLLIVGDLFHAGKNGDLDIFCEWRKKFCDLKLTLIKGNHDRIKKAFYEEHCIDLVEKELVMGSFVFIHEPNVDQNYYSISGHIHPGVVFGTHKEKLKLPCFAYSKNQLILPAFSEFTGLDTKTLQKNYKSIAFTKQHIFEI